MLQMLWLWLCLPCLCVGSPPAMQMHTLSQPCPLVSSRLPTELPKLR